MYPYINPQTHVSYQDSLYNLAQAKHAVQTNFCLRFKSYMADDFDAITKDYCKIRRQQLCSADAFHENSVNDLIFVEFKDKSKEYLDQIGRGTPKIDPSTGVEEKDETTEVSLHKKAIDSIAVASGTVCNTLPQIAISQGAMFIVVRQDGPEYFEKIVKGIQTLACLNDRPLWGLVDLINNGIYREVYTVTESEFGALLAVIW